MGMGGNRKWLQLLQQQAAQANQPSGPANPAIDLMNRGAPIVGALPGSGFQMPPGIFGGANLMALMQRQLSMPAYGLGLGGFAGAGASGPTASFLPGLGGLNTSQPMAPAFFSGRSGGNAMTRELLAQLRGGY